MTRWFRRPSGTEDVLEPPVWPMPRQPELVVQPAQAQRHLAAAQLQRQLGMPQRQLMPLASAYRPLGTAHRPLGPAQRDPGTAQRDGGSAQRNLSAAQRDQGSAQRSPAPIQPQRQLAPTQPQRPLSPARPRADQTADSSDQGQHSGSTGQWCLLPGGSLGGIMYGGGLPGDAGQLFGPNSALVDLPWRGSAGEAHPMASVGASVTVNGVSYTMDENEALLIFHAVVRDLDVDPHWCPGVDPDQTEEPATGGH